MSDAVKLLAVSVMFFGAAFLTFMLWWGEVEVEDGPSLSDLSTRLGEPTSPPRSDPYP
jgi:hypothetical protein